MQAIRPFTQIYNDFKGEDILNKVNDMLKMGCSDALEHVSITVRFVVDRATARKLSTPCGYPEGSFDEGIPFIIPDGMSYKSEGWEIWKNTVKACEEAYFKLLNFGLLSEDAMIILPDSVVSEVILTLNLQEWRNFFFMYIDEPKMQDISRSLLDEMKKVIPEIFDDITYQEGAA